jgi:DNA invertase Pin-like site-specific DNA recombinase
MSDLNQPNSDSCHEIPTPMRSPAPSIRSRGKSDVKLGWSEARVIDDDLGRSGDGSEWPGFEKLLAAICEGNVGAVLSIEASRLARNGRDWHTLLEFCGVGSLVVDEDGVYDPRSPND